MNKSIVWACLGAAALALSGCSGGSEPAADEKPAPAAKKAGEKEEASPWAKDGPAGSAPTEAPKKKAKKKGAAEVSGSPWAKESPNPTAT